MLFDPGPTWTEVGALFAAADSALDTIYWPWMVDTAGLPGEYEHRFRVYYSTNHDAGPGGIALAEADDLTGPWTHRLIYTDTHAGTQTETPSVVYVPEMGMWHLYYQQSGVGVNQSTLLATSPDGVTAWSRVGIVIDIVAGAFPGDGHTGYAIPHRLPGGTWLAYHLMGGGNFPHFGQSWSRDGVEWQVEPRPLGYTSHLVPAGRRTEWNTGYLVQRGDVTWWVGMLSDFVSGGAVKSTIVAQAPIAPDLRTLLAPPATILEAADHQTINVTTASTGETYLIYQLGDTFYLMQGADA
jgi:hypothetical protein